MRRPSCCMLYEGSRSRCTWSWELVDSGNHKSSTSSFQISMAVWGFSERFGRERGCSAMHVAACCAHACSTVAGGKAAAFHGVFQHHTPCVDQIFPSAIELGNKIFIRKGMPAPLCPALPLHCTRLAMPRSCARLTTPCLALCRSSFGRFLHPQEHPSTPWRRIVRSFLWCRWFLLQMSS